MDTEAAMSCRLAPSGDNEAQTSTSSEQHHAQAYTNTHRRHQGKRELYHNHRHHHLATFQLMRLTTLVILAFALGRAQGQGSVTPAANFDLGDGEQQTNSNNDRQSNSKQIDLNALVSQESNFNNNKQQQVSHKSSLNGRQFGDSISDIQIECNSNNIMVTLQTSSGFSGMIYPKGLSKNSTCMTEYHQLASNITYFLPLKSCNTMSTDVEDGVEYFNTVMVQPHRRLVTNQGRGYHIRCRYQTKERTITNQEQQLSVNLTQVTPAVMGSARVPGCTMRIYSANDLTREVSAENVHIGDELQLIIDLDEQEVYGMLVTNCLVRDGMNWGEQPLIDERGCPVDDEIMPQFVYAQNLSRASVTFQAHKFPYTSSVYYQCNVRLCFRDNGCQAHVPPNCSGGGGSRSMSSSSFTQQGRQPPMQTAAHNSYRQAAAAAANELDSLPAEENSLAEATAQRHRQSSGTVARTRRWVDAGELDGVASEELLKPRALPLSATGGDLTLEVSSGLRVDERETLGGAPEKREASDEADPLMAAATNDDPEVNGGAGGGVSEISGTAAEEQATTTAGDKKQSEREFCLSLRKFAIVISLISLLLMAAIILLIACLIKRRNRQKLEAQLNQTYDRHNQRQDYDNYGGAPYANRAYCRD